MWKARRCIIHWSIATGRLGIDLHYKQAGLYRIWLSCFRPVRLALVCRGGREKKEDREKKRKGPNITPYVLLVALSSHFAQSFLRHYGSQNRHAHASNRSSF